MLKNRITSNHSSNPRQAATSGQLGSGRTKLLLLVVLVALAVPYRRHMGANGAELHRVNMSQEQQQQPSSVSGNYHPISQRPQPLPLASSKQQEQPISAMPHSRAMATRSHQQQQQRQGDELNVMGQKVIVVVSYANSNASSKLDQAAGAAAAGGHSNGHSHQREPLQHIDPAAAAASNPASKYPSPAGSVRQFNGTQMGRLDQLQQQQHSNQPPEFNVGASDPKAARPSHNESLAPGNPLGVATPPAAAAAAAAANGHRELHFGAKVALSILVAVILLVASATFVDLNSSATDGVPTGAAAAATATNRQMGAANLVLHHQQSQQTLKLADGRKEDRLQGAPSPRDQRSPSLSSSGSSTLFSSANSLSSASAPILSNRFKNNNTNCAPQDTTGPPCQPGPAPRAQQHGGGCSSSSSCYCCSSHSWLDRIGSQLADTCGGLTRRRNQQYCHNRQFNSTPAPPLEQQTIVSVMVGLETGSEKQEASLRAAVLKATNAAAAAAAACNNQQQQTYSMMSDKSQASVGGWRRRKGLARQVFLSFSLRHSASLIFERDTPAPEAQRRKSQQSSPLFGSQCGACTHRSRLSVNEEATSTGNSSDQLGDLDDATSSSDMVCDSDPCCSCCCSAMFHQDPHHQLAPASGTNLHFQSDTTTTNAVGSSKSESIDSLHGLRFLSMIWIIVIHSYGFALRWLFFANSPTLNDIYKTAASQLLANGTFACDSFFFAGGFLLPYLAFPAYKPPPQSGSHTQEQYCCSTSPSPLGAPRSPLAGTTLRAENNGMLEEQQRRHDQQLCSKQDINPTCRSTCSSSLQQQQRKQDSLSSGGFYCNSRQSSATGASFRKHLAGPRAQQIEPPPPAAVAWQSAGLNTNEFTMRKVVANILHRYIRMMPLMMAIIGLSASLLRYMGEGPTWDDSTIMFDKWCRQNWWINALFLHNFVNRENMCLGHSWYSAVDIQLFLIGQVIMFILFRSKRWGLMLCCALLIGAQLLTGALTLLHHLPAVPLIASVSEQSMNLYYGEIYIKPYCRASPYLIGMLLAYLMRTTSLGQIKLNKWQVATGWTASIGTLVAILMAMQPAMNGQVPTELQSALYSSLSRPLWACATGWMIFACMTKHGGIFAAILGARCFVPLSRLTYPAFLIHPIVMAVFYGSRQSSFQFSHYLMLYLILGNIVITYALAFLLSALFELPLLSVERAIKRSWSQKMEEETGRGQGATKDANHHHYHYHSRH